jgi:aspartyl-tRNA(Asn)/glutamyl-tRNA(Gln) amidotransferase subunit C
MVAAVRTEKRDTIAGGHRMGADCARWSRRKTVAELTLEAVRHVAELAHLRFSPEELERLRGELEGILTHINQLQEVDTAAIPPTAQVIEVTTVLRQDAVRPSLPVDVALRNVPRTEENFIEVDAVLEES